MDKLGRAGAVRERKGEVHEMNGHQFVEKRFYNIMKCALCGDFMAKLTYQCEGNFEIFHSLKMRNWHSNTACVRLRLGMS
jgi:hypothetical protein